MIDLDFTKERHPYNFSAQSYPGIFFIFLKTITPEGQPYERVAFFQAEENAWLSLQNVWNDIPVGQLEHLFNDAQEYPRRNFVCKVLISAPLYACPQERAKVLEEIKEKFKLIKMVINTDLKERNSRK